MRFIGREAREGQNPNGERDVKLWHLLPREGLSPDPWEPWYDKCFGQVVRAQTEEAARAIANKSGGAEVPWSFGKGRRGDTGPWLDPALTTCVELAADGEPGCILTDIHSA
jgi:hypothetical protein